MQRGMIGLGRMGTDMTRRLLRGGGVYNDTPEPVQALAAGGVHAATSYAETSPLRHPDPFQFDFDLAAVDAGVPAHVLSAAFYARFASRDEAEFQNRVHSALRHACGGHLEKTGGNS